MKRISEYYEKDSLSRLKNEVFSLTFILVVILLITTKGGSISGLENDHWIFTILNIMAFFIGLYLARQTLRLRTLDLMLKNFHRLIDNKENFIPIWQDLYVLKKDYGEVTSGIRDFEAHLKLEFNIKELEDYISVWKKVPSIFSKRLPREYSEPTYLIKPMNFNSIRGIARLIGSKKFSEIIIKKALDHDAIKIINEQPFEKEYRITYKTLIAID